MISFHKQLQGKKSFTCICLQSSGRVALFFGIMTISFLKITGRPQQEQEIMFEHSEPVQSNHECHGPWQWMCEDGIECIAQYDVCDGITQCSDHSDEKNCYNRMGENNQNLQRQPHYPPKNFDNALTTHQHQENGELPSKSTTPKPQQKLNIVTESRLPMKYGFGSLSIFVVFAFIVHTLLKRRKRLSDEVRGFRHGESLVEDEDDLLISQMYT